MKKIMYLIGFTLLLAACGGGGTEGEPNNSQVPVQMAKLALGNFSTASGEYPVTTVMRFPVFPNVSSSSLLLQSNSVERKYVFTNKSYTVTQDTEITCVYEGCLHLWTVTSNNVLSEPPIPGGYTATLMMRSHGVFFRGDIIQYLVQ